MEAILFDWDGTLVDSLGAFHRANATVMESFGLPFDVVRYRQHYAPDWREMYSRLGVPRNRLDEANTLGHALVLHRRVFHRGQLLDPGPDDRVRFVRLGDAIGQVRGPPHRLARDDDEAVAKGVDVDRDRVEALIDREWNDLALVLERTPVAPHSGFETHSTQDQGAVIGVLEFIGCVDPPVDPDVGPPTGGREPVRLGDSDPGRGRQQTPDPVLGAERPKDHPAGHEGEQPRGAEEEGRHEPDDIRQVVRRPVRVTPAWPGAHAGHEETRRNLLAAWALM